LVLLVRFSLGSQTRCEELTDEFVNAQLRRLDLLDYLHTNNLPIDVS